MKQKATSETESKIVYKRTAGVLFAVIAALVGIAAAVIYYRSYGETQYYDKIAALLPFVGAALFVVLWCIRPTANFAPAVLFACVFAAFLVYVHAVYMYLSEVFYSGITSEAIASIAPEFIFTTALYLGASVLTNIAAWVKQIKPAIAQ